MITIGEVVDVNDINNGQRIRVRIRPTDNYIQKNNEIPFAFPLLPKMLHVKPKVGEAVFIIFTDDKNEQSQRYYIGPIISQSQFINKDLYGAGATNMLQGAIFSPSPSLKNETDGLLASNDDVAINGRKNTDIILKDNDLQIRCGVKLITNKNIEYNKRNPSFLKIKYYPNALLHKTNDSMEDVHSVATLFAHKINLISSDGTPYIESSDKKELLDDNTILNILDTAHQLPYGDKLCELLSEFIKVFKRHTHNYNNLPIVHDPNYLQFINKYGEDGAHLKDILLSKNIRIN